MTPPEHDGEDPGPRDSPLLPTIEASALDILTTGSLDPPLDESGVGSLCSLGEDWTMMTAIPIGESLDANGGRAQLMMASPVPIEPRDIGTWAGGGRRGLEQLELSPSMSSCEASPRNFGLSPASSAKARRTIGRAEGLVRRSRNPGGHQGRLGTSPSDATPMLSLGSTPGRNRSFGAFVSSRFSIGVPSPGDTWAESNVGRKIRPSVSPRPPPSNHKAYGVDGSHDGRPLLILSAPPGAGGESGNGDASAAPPDTATGEFFKAVLYGVINGIILLPVLVGYTQIIFSHPFFFKHGYLSVLTKLVTFSSMVHQACFTAKSSMPFAIGQVQDAGLIFLSAMATTIVDETQQQGATPEETLATVLVWLALSTCLLGVALVLTGKMKLANVVQYLPLPVVGGYLAFIGIFCLEAGLSLMTGQQIDGVSTWGLLFKSWHSSVLAAPGIVGGALLLFMVLRFKHVAVLPSCMLAIPAAFYIVLFAGGWSLDEARGTWGVGWLSAPEDEAPFYESWSHFQFDKVKWSVIPSVLPTWFAMYVVVSFSSSLDVAAIAMQLGKPLNFNSELEMVGWSNIVSGLTGGYTGSYIFSQTIFTMKARLLYNRTNGATIIAFLFVMFCTPITFMAYIPKLFFGAILIFIAFDLMLEWLWEARHLVHAGEYVIIWCTFIAILCTTLEIGMLVGTGLSVLEFLLLYARSNGATKMQPPRSTVVRGFQQRRILAKHCSSIRAHALEGYLFFGTAVQILGEVKRTIVVAEDVKQNSNGKGAPQPRSRKSKTSVASPTPTADDRTSTTQSLHTASSSGSRGTRMAKKERLTKFVILDFSAVTGVDATTARTLFATLGQLLKSLKIKLLVTDVDDRIRKLLEGHDLFNESIGCLQFATLDDGLAYCENQLLQLLQPGLHPSRLTQADCSIRALLTAYLFESNTFPPAKINMRAELLERFFDIRTVDAGGPLFLAGEFSDSIWFIKSGEVVMYAGKRPQVQPDTAGSPRRRKKWSIQNIKKLFKRSDAGRGSDKFHRVAEYHQGGIIGARDFYARHPRSYTAEAMCETVLYELHRGRLDKLCREHKEEATIIQHVLLKSMALVATQSRIEAVANRAN